MRTHFAQSPLTRALLVLVCGATLGCPDKGEEATDTQVTTDATTGTTTTTTDDSGASTSTSEPTSTMTTTTTGGELTTTGDTLGTTTMEADARCDCVETWSFGPDSYACPKGSCGVLNARCESEDGETGGGECVLTGVTEERIDCALDRLIAAEVGFGAMYTWTSDGGFSESGQWVTIVGPGRTAVMRSWSWLDLSGDESSAGLVQLKDAAYFEGCKAEPDLKARFHCLTDWTDDEPDALCDEEGSRSDV
ncbi:hypothetical protein [Nannocystis pusilla]|uniref:hypothetical protein n=1 Tax=Nannocystis pusilla TaxID=889268 RepID=UPI003DA69248